MTKNESPKIGLFIPPCDYNIHELYWLGIVDAARQQNFHLISLFGDAIDVPYAFKSQSNILYKLAQKASFDGLIAVTEGLQSYIGVVAVEQFLRQFAHTPIVSIERSFPGIPGVLMDNYQAMREVMLHLLQDHGYRRIAFIRGPEGHEGIQERYRAYRDALLEYGCFDPDLVGLPGTWEIEHGAKTVALLLDQRQTHFEAIACCSDTFAFPAIQALEMRGLNVPQQVAIVGFDDNEETKFLTPPITTVRPPFYHMGWQAIQLLTTWLQHKERPADIVIPTDVIVRQSCGCISSTVRHAASPIQVSTQHANEKRPIPEILDIVRPRLQSAAADLIGRSPSVAVRVMQLCESLLADIMIPGNQPPVFLSTLETVLRHIASEEQPLAPWQHLVSLLRQYLLPLFPSGEQQWSDAENLCHQARVMIGERLQRIQAFDAFRTRQANIVLERIGQTLITTFHLNELMDILAEELPRLGFSGGYLALYEDASAPTEWARLMFAYHENERIACPRDGWRFPSPQFVPNELWRDECVWNIVVQSLYFHEEQIGFIVLDVGPRTGQTYTILRGEISSALKGALLVQRVQEHAEELGRAYQEIQQLNHQLLQENLRMGAELDIARRLQQMVLPMPHELTQIPGLDIVGYMQPAEEVGGDYYDVLHCQQGRVCIGIGDVTGHGLESGVLMLMTQTTIRTLIDRGESDPVVFLNTLNRVIYQNIQRMGVDRSVTLAMINYQAGQLRLIGQHEEALIVRRDGRIERMDTVNLGFPLGMVEDIRAWVAEATVTLSSGDGVVLYTDGITEAQNAANDFYGLERLCAIISATWREASVEAVKDAIVADVRAFIGGAQVYDDMTLVVLKQQ